jgi:hypothetical protein
MSMMHHHSHYLSNTLNTNNNNSNFPGYNFNLVQNVQKLVQSINSQFSKIFINTGITKIFIHFFSLSNQMK